MRLIRLASKQWPRAWLPASLILCGLPFSSLYAQQARNPHVGYIFPAGGQRGTTFEVTIGGQFLDGAKDAIVSGSGIKITVVEINKPLPEKRFNELRDYIEEARKKLLVSPVSSPSPGIAVSPMPAKLAASSPTPSLAVSPTPAISVLATPATQASPAPSIPSPSPKAKPSKPFGAEKITQILKSSGATDIEIKKFFEIRKERSDPKRQQNRQIDESVTLRAEISPDARLGLAEIRLTTPLGVSNPLNFCISNLPEITGSGLTGKDFNTATRITTPMILNGQILPGAVHHYSLQARRGQQLVISVQARELIPYIADTVPGWFQAVAALYDSKGNQVAYADHFRFHQDPVLFFEVPTNGLYLLELRDSLFRGRKDFVYRVTIGDLPYPTDIFPLGGQLGEASKVNLSGWNLKQNQFSLASGSNTGLQPLSYSGSVSDNLPFSWDNLPEVFSQQSNGTPIIQPVKLPVIINGHIMAPGQIDAFAFFCRAGENIVAEVSARRLNSPLDSVLKVTDGRGHQLAFNDDCEDKGAGLLTHCADSRVAFTAPATGTYRVSLADAQGNSGPEYAYRLRISDPLPDFDLRTTVSALAGRPGITAPLTVYAIRKDGFNGDISIALKGQPEGTVLNGGWIPAGQNQVTMTITLPQLPQQLSMPLAMEGRATINGREVTHAVIPADDMVQAFMYHHLVPATEFIAAISGTNRGRAPIKILTPIPLPLKPGGSANALLSMQGHAPFSLPETQLQLTNPPDGIRIDGVSLVGNAVSVSFKADPAKAKPGLRGNLIVEAFVERTPPIQNGKPAEKKRWSIGYLPAIPFSVTQ